MAQLFVSFLIVLHLLFRGDINVRSHFTGRQKLHRQCCFTRNGIERCIVLRCKQIKHVVVYERWYILNRTFYTYEVEMVKVDNDVYQDYHVGHYPHLCTRLLHSTDYPLNCAISAHLDSILGDSVLRSDCDRNKDN